MFLFFLINFCSDSIFLCCRQSFFFLFFCIFLSWASFWRFWERNNTYYCTYISYLKKKKKKKYRDTNVAALSTRNISISYQSFVDCFLPFDFDLGFLFLFLLFRWRRDSDVVGIFGFLLFLFAFLFFSDKLLCQNRCGNYLFHIHIYFLPTAGWLLPVPRRRPQMATNDYWYSFLFLLIGNIFSGFFLFVFAVRSHPFSHGTKINGPTPPGATIKTPEIQKNIPIAFCPFAWAAIQQIASHLVSNRWRSNCLQSTPLWQAHGVRNRSRHMAEDTHTHTHGRTHTCAY